MKKEITFIVCCLALLVLGMAQPQMPHSSGKINKNLELERDKSNFPQKQTFQAKSAEWWEPDTAYGYDAGSTHVNDRYIYSYNAQGLLTECLIQLWQNNNWVNYSKATYTYDAKNNLLIYLSQSWQGGTWKDFWKETCTYDANNNLLTLLSEVWTPIQRNNYLHTYTYDSNNNMLTYLVQGWKDNAWEYHSENIYTYDSNNNLLTEIFFYPGGDRYKETYTYDSKNNRLTKLGQSWNDNDWKDAVNYIYTYDANNNLQTELMQYPSDEGWENGSMSTYTYDTNNNLLTEFKQYMSDEGWENGSMSTYAYDANNNLLTEFKQFWDDTWVNSKQILRSYDENNNSIMAEQWFWDGEDWQQLQEPLGLYYNNMQSYFSNFRGHKLTASYTKTSVSISGKVEYPDQTPFSSGDILLYAVQNTGYYSLIHTLRLLDNGNYTFENIKDGNYVIKVIPDDLENLLPTYYGNTELWNEAFVVEVSIPNGVSFHNMDITMLDIEPLEGSSTISGYVEESDGRKSISKSKTGNPVPDVTVYLQSNQGGENWKTIAYSSTDTKGFFIFEKIPIGKYRVILDIPGLVITTPPVVEITEEGQVIDDVSFEIPPLSIDETTKIEKQIKVFPNPSNGHFTIASEKVIENIELYDMLGKKVFSDVPKTQTIQINTHLPQGLYIYRAVLQGGTISSGKIIVQ